MMQCSRPSTSSTSLTFQRVRRATAEKDANGNVVADYTLWTTASDLKTLRYYFRTYDNSQIRMLDLMKMAIDGKDIVTVSMKGDEVISSLTP